MKILSYPHALGWTLAATIFVHMGALMLVRVWPPAQFDIVLLGALQVIVYAGVIRLFMSVYGESMGADPLALGKTKPLLVLVAIALGVVLQIPAATMVELIDKVWPTQDAELAERMARLAAQTPARRVIVASVVAGFGPLVEELFFRGALTSGLLKSASRRGTAICVAAAFAIAHVDPRIWPPLFVVGLVLTYLRIAGGSVWPAFALHAAFNLTTLLTIYTEGVPTGRPPPLPWSVTAVGFATSFVLLFIIYKLTSPARSEPEPKHGAGSP